MAHAEGRFIFSKENENLRSSVVEMYKTSEEFVRKNQKLCELLKQSGEQMDKLEDIKRQYEKENERYKGLLEDEKDNIIDVGFSNACRMFIF